MIEAALRVETKSIGPGGRHGAIDNREDRFGPAHHVRVAIWQCVIEIEGQKGLVAGTDTSLHQ
jgi:hypothetical protein